jgi:hypothetical protein
VPKSSEAYPYDRASMHGITGGSQVLCFKALAVVSESACSDQDGQSRTKSQLRRLEIFISGRLVSPIVAIHTFSSFS